MFYLYLREPKDEESATYMVTDNSDSYYVCSDTIHESINRLDTWWSSRIEDSSDRYLLIAKFTSFEDLQKTHPELFI